MEHFVIIVKGWKPLTIITKRSILDVAAVLDPPLKNFYKTRYVENLEEIITVGKWEDKEKKLLQEKDSTDELGKACVKYLTVPAIAYLGNIFLKLPT